jgi:hypothetical protein
MLDLAIKHGYYFVVSLDNENKVFHVEIGKGYIDDDVKDFTVKEEDGFLTYSVNGKRETMRDTSLSNSFEDVVNAFLHRIIESYTANALVKRDGDKLIPFYDEVN